MASVFSKAKNLVRASPAAFVAALFFVVGCSSSSGDGSCSDGSLIPIIATVSDVKTGAPICNALVTATLNGNTLTLTEGGSDAGCSYELSGGSGNFTVSATAPGYGSATSAVDLQADSCGRAMATQTVTFKLTPQS